MDRSRSTRIGDISAMVRVMEDVKVQSGTATPADEKRRQRQMLAGFIRFLEQHVRAKGSPAKADGLERLYTAQKHLSEAAAALPPRTMQTLERLLAGDSEKQIGMNLGVSRNTVHVYVGQIYRHFDVNTRGELLAQFVAAPESRC